MIIHSCTLQGKREYQEDRYVIRNKLHKYTLAGNDVSESENLSNHPIDFLGIFDGHGGSHISDTLAKILPSYFYKHNVFEDNTPKPHQTYTNYIISTFDQVQNELNAKNNKSSLQGSTVCLSLIYYFRDRKYLTVAWSGDSRAIACNNNYIAESLTLDHKPDSPLEMKRIIQLGGSVSFEPNDVPRINGVLAVSRSLGDFDQKKLVEHKPDVIHYVCNNYKFIIVASDGLYDSMNNQQIVDFVLTCVSDNPNILSKNQNNKNNLNIASKLAMKAMELGSEDNITVIIYFNDNNIF
jgi:serine/threonine protein phosphatase PrpC